MLKDVDYGCYADGSFGHQHIRTVLSDFVRVLGDIKLSDSLNGEMPDDAWDEYEALDKLNNVTQTPGYWDLHDGDLIFRKDGEE